MPRKHILLSTLLVTLCMSVATLTVSRTHTASAASSLDNTTKAPLSSLHSTSPNDSVQNNVYLIVGSTAITALNATTGNQLWQFQPGGYLLSTPIVFNNAVYVLMPGKSFPVLYALNLSTGTTLWTFQPSGYLNSPVFNSALYVTVDSATQNTSTLYALNPTTGTTLWTFQPGAHLAFPVINSHVVYIGTGYPSSVYALKTSNGQQIWHSQSINSTIYLDKNMHGILYGDAQGPNNTFGYLYAFTASNGNYLWSISGALLTARSGITYAEEGTYASPSICALNSSNSGQLWCVSGFSASVANGLAYVSTNQFALQVVNASSGAPVWSNQKAHFLKVSKGTVYAVDNNNFIEALDAYTGALSWHSQINYGVGSNYSLLNGALYLTSQDNSKAYALDTTNGVLRWSYSVPGGIFSLIITHGVAYIASNNGIIYALNANTGTLIWQH